MRAWPLVSLIVLTACRPPGIGDGSEETETTTTTTTTDAETTGTESETTSADTETTDEGTDTGGEDPCESSIPGVEHLRCVLYPDALAYDGAWVYYSYSDNDSRILERVRDDASEIQVVAEGVGDLRRLTIVDGLIYWNDFYGGRVARVPLEGGVIEEIIVDLYKPNSYVIHEGQLYVSQYADAQDIVRVDIEGGVIDVLYSGYDYPGALHRVGQDLYWMTNSNDGNVDNDMMRGTLDGAPEELLMQDGGGIISDEAYIYFLAAGQQGLVQRMPHAGGPIEDVTTLDHPAATLIDGDYLYARYVSVDQSAHGGELHRVPKSGGALELLVDGLNYPSYFLVGGTHIYWTSQQAISRMALP